MCVSCEVITLALSCSPAQHAYVVVGVASSDCGFLWFAFGSWPGLLLSDDLSLCGLS